MGYSFDTTRHYPRESLRQSGRSGCRTRRSYLPRSALSNQSEDIDLIREYLRAAPSQGLVSSAAKLPLQEQPSGLSRTDTKGKKRALDVLSLPSRPIRRLLRSRSTSPAPFLKRSIVQQETTKGVRYCQIVQDLESLTKLENPSASRVNCHGKHKISNPIPEVRAAEVNRVSCSTGIVEPGSSFKDMLGPDSHFVDQDGLGWATEHPQWLPIQQRSSSPCHKPSISKKDTPTKSIPSPRHNVGPVARDFASKATTASIETGNAESVERHGPGRSFRSLGKEAQTNQQWTPTTSSNMRPSYTMDTRRQTDAALSDGSRSYSSFQTNTSPHLSRQGTLAARLSGPASTIEADKSTPHNSAGLVVAEGPASDTSSNVDMNAQSTNLTNARQPTNPGPAPVGPLPPIPNGCGSGSSRSGDSGKDTYNVDLGTCRPLTTVPEKSSARDRYPNIDSIKKSKSTSLPKNTTAAPDFDQEWPRPPTFKASTGTLCARNSESPMTLALDDEDPFGFQRHIEKSATRRVKKSAIAKRRHLEDTRNHEGTNGVENSGTRDGKPDRERCEEFAVFLPRGKRGSDVSHPCDGIGEAQQVDDLETPERRNEQKGRPQDIETIVRYRNHSTQFSPQRRQILVSPPRSPRPPTPEEERDRKEKMARPSGTIRSCSSCHAAPADALNTEKPDSLAWYLADLESRLESRLKAFERRTVLLEAALLAVINASANLGADDRSSDIDRSSRISGLSEKFTPLEAKLEAMVAVMQGARNSAADI